MTETGRKPTIRGPILAGVRLTKRALLPYAWAVGGVVAATAVFFLARPYVDKGQASLLFLPVVIACAVRFGFGPAVVGAILSFFSWDFFFLPPYYTFVVANPQDWLSLVVFLIAAITTARLASAARNQAAEARTREAEIATLFQASETISREVSDPKVLASLARQILTTCRASRCVIYRSSPITKTLHLLYETDEPHVPNTEPEIELAIAAFEHRQVIGFEITSRELWTKALGGRKNIGVYIPLLTEEAPSGALYVGPRADGQSFSAIDQRLILTLANHAAVVIAREQLAEQAAQAAALREADTLKNSLLSLVSHELRSPLAAIKATASGLIQQPRSEISEDALQTINSEADRLSHLVSNLLDLSRLEAGAWKPAKDWCDLEEIASTALDRLGDTDAQRVEIEAAPNVPLIKADYTQIALVLTNLLSNAIKYTGPIAPIELNFSPIYNGIDETPCGAMIRVRDYGEGISTAEEESVFERFFRSSKHQASTVHGTGLGLALCKAIVSGHGGRIWASNAPPDRPSGAVFTVTLPVE